MLGWWIRNWRRIPLCHRELPSPGSWSWRTRVGCAWKKCVDKSNIHFLSVACLLCVLDWQTFGTWVNHMQTWSVWKGSRLCIDNSEEWTDNILNQIIIGFLCHIIYQEEILSVKMSISQSWTHWLWENCKDSLGTK